MGAKDWFVAYIDDNMDVAAALRSTPSPDPAATCALVERLHPGVHLDRIPDGNLSENANPGGGLVYAGAYPGVSIVCTQEVAVDHPSTLDSRYLAVADGRRVILHAMHSVVDFFAYAVWSAEGELVRSLSLSPDAGVHEDIGERFAFEAPYWAGEHPVEDDDEPPYPLPFHPLELAEDALASFFGFTYEGPLDPDAPVLEELVLLGFATSA